MAADNRIALLTAGTEDHDLTRLDEYRAVGGYDALERARELEPQAVIDEITGATVRGRGGAGFPMGRKASLLARDTGKPIYLVVNADESEPGASKDRDVMGLTPHRLIEGCLITAHGIGSESVFIYIRGEYLHEFEVMRSALDDARRAGAARRRHDRPPPGRRRLHLRRGDRTPRVARGPARPAAAAAALPAGERPLRRADADQQREHDRARAEGRRARRRAVREDRRPLRARHGRVLALRQRRRAGELRAPARDHAARADLRRRRRSRERPRAQGRHPRRLVGAGADAGRDRHADGLRLDPGRRLVLRLGRDHRRRRPLLHGAARPARGPVLHARVMRQVHAVPRGDALARPDPDEARVRPRARRPISTSSTTSATACSASRSARSATSPSTRCRATCGSTATSSRPTSSTCAARSRARARSRASSRPSTSHGAHAEAAHA